MVREETSRDKDRFKISELFDDERCSKAILDFLATTDSGTTGGGRGTRQRGLGVGEERTRGIPCTGGGGERVLGEGAEDWGAGELPIIFSFFLFFVVTSYVNHRKAEGIHSILQK